MLLKTCVCSLLLLAQFAFAASPSLKLECLTVGSRSYTNVTVIGANETDLYFTHQAGIANVKLRLLSPELKKRFKYNPKVAAEAERLQAQQYAEYQSGIASNLAAKAEERLLAAKKAAATSEDSLADPISDSSLLGKPAPKLEFQHWLTDKPDLADKFVLVTFWAPWSIPSRKAIPALNALQKKFPQQLAIIAVTSESQADVEKATDVPFEFASALDPQAKLFSAAGVTSVPSAMLIDPEGIVRYEGPPAGLSEATLEKLLKKPAK